VARLSRAAVGAAADLPSAGVSVSAEAFSRVFGVETLVPSSASASASAAAGSGRGTAYGAGCASEGYVAAPPSPELGELSGMEAEDDATLSVFERSVSSVSAGDMDASYDSARRHHQLLRGSGGGGGGGGGCSLGPSQPHFGRASASTF